MIESTLVQNQQLKAGAGRAAIEFPPSIFPIEGYERLLDQPQVRILLLEANIQLAIVSVDITSIPTEIIADFKKIASQTAKIPEENILICATHTFSMPHFMPEQICKTTADKHQNEILFNLYKSAIQKAAQIARTEMKEARFGYETGTCDININRDILTKDGWWLGSNEIGPSDKTVIVLRFDDLEGRPISILFNYAVQPSVLDGSLTLNGAKLLSADLAGAASRLIEQEFEGKTVAIFFIGAAGDQAPLHKSKQNYLDANGNVEVKDFHEEGIILAESLGRLLGAEVLRVSKEIHSQPLKSAIKLESHSVRCPGQRMPMEIQSIKPTKSYNFRPDEDRDEPFEILTIGPVALVCLRPELTNQTASEIKRGSSFPITMVLTMVNGAAKYMPDQSAYDRLTYEAMNSPFGCGSAELLREKIIQVLNR